MWMCGTTRATYCIGRYALKFPRSLLGCAANDAERVEWKRATAERRDIMCPLLWSAPFGLLNIMERAIQMTDEQRSRLRAFPDWDYRPGGPECPFEYKPDDWGYLDDGRLVALDYPAVDVMNRWEGIE